jgi:hypothetical protein
MEEAEKKRVSSSEKQSLKWCGDFDQIGGFGL